MTYQEIIQLIRTERKRKKLTQPQMANKSSLGVCYYKRVEVFKATLDVQSMVRIFDVLDLTIEIK